MSELIDREALENWVRTEMASLDTYEDKEYVIERWRKELPSVAAPRWNKVEEPPKENGRYFVSWEGAVTTDEYKNGVWLYASMFNIRVTHWMPIPEPPKEDA